MAQAHSKNIGAGHSRVETIVIPKNIQKSLDALPPKQKRDWAPWEDKVLTTYAGLKSMQAIARILGRGRTSCSERFLVLKNK